MTDALYLYAQSVPASDLAELTALLSEIDFIGSNQLAAPFLPGAELMEYITFLGCSPALQRGEIKSDIRIHEFQQPTALGGESIHTLRFPGCKHVIEQPGEIVQHFNQPWQCPVCGHTGRFEDIQWRKSAAISTLFIEISEIFPKEAVPSDKLLELLQKHSGSSWGWFYARSSAPNH